MKKKDRYDEILNYFRKTMPNATTELNYRNGYELIAAVILSAQCTDKRVNMVTPGLFDKYPELKDLAAATPEEVYSLISSISYPNSKADYLVGMARELMDNYGGQIPGDRESLEALPGVGRKTANVVMSVLYNEPVMPVDSHVFRVSHRLGLVTKSCRTPTSVEKVLMKYIPIEDVCKAHHWLILHGRYTCKSVNPACDECGLTQLCTYKPEKKPAKTKAKTKAKTQRTRKTRKTATQRKRKKEN